MGVQSIQVTPLLVTKPDEHSPFISAPVTTSPFSASGTIDDGGRVVSTGELVFTSGGASYVGSGLSNLSGGFQEILVLDRGSIESSIVSLGAYVEVTSGGTASFDVISGTIDVLSGGVTSGLTITQRGIENVMSGGLDSGSYLSYAFQNVLSGGLAVGVGVSDATQNLKGGQSISTYLSAAGEQDVLVGGVASATVVAAGGILVVEAGGIATGAQLFGSALVSGGALDDVTIGQGGQAYVYSGGTVTSGTVGSDGLVIVSSGGTVSDLVLSSGGYVVALSGSVLSGIVLSGGEVISTGVVAHEGDGRLIVGNTLSGIDLRAGSALVLDDGTLTSASNGVVSVLSGGTVTDAVVLGITDGPGNGLEALTILSGGLGVNIHAETSNGSILDDGGTVVSGYVSHQGRLYIVSGGLGQVDSASSGGVIFNQSVTSGDHIFASGGEEAYHGGKSEYSVVSGAWASMLALDGTIASAHVEGAGFITISTGGYSTASVIASGGLERLAAGGVSLDDTVSSGILIAESGGIVSSVTVESGGIVFLGSGAVLDGADVASGGILVVAPGASASNTSMTGGQVVSTGVVEFTGANQGTYHSQSLSNAYVSAGEVIVLSGGVTSGITAEGSPYVLLGRSGATPGRGTQVLVESGGSAFNNIIGGSGNLYRSEQDVFSGGLASGTTVQSDGEEVVLAGGISNDVAISGSEIVFGNVSGATIFSSGVLLVSSGGHLAGGHVMSGGVLELVGNSAAEIEQATGVLSLDAGAEIYLLGIQSAGAVSGTWDAATGQLELSIGGTAIDLDLAGDYSNDYFIVSGTTSYVTVTVEQGTPCYCPGTLILTNDGELPIESLRIGDRLVTRDGTARPLKWIGRRSYDGRFLTARTDILPVTFATGSLGQDAAGLPVPRRPLTVSPLHAMFLDGMLVPASALVDGRQIVQAVSVDQVEYIHLELDTHDVIVAEGALSESFVDDGSRGMFQNANEYARLYPDAPRGPALFCAPRVEDGDCLEAIRARLAA